MPYTPLKISIPEPCHEDWREMNPVAGTTARHCASCVKNVVDFTGFTDAQVHAYVRANPGKLCGRFRADQLDRPLRAATKLVSNPLRVAAAAAGLMLAASGCESVSEEVAATKAREPLEILEEGIVLAPPATGGISLTKVEEELIEMTVPGLVDDPPPPPPPPASGYVSIAPASEIPPPPPQDIAETGEFEWTAGDVELTEEDLPAPLATETAVTVANLTPPALASPIIPTSEQAPAPDPCNRILLGVTVTVPPEPTGIDFLRDSLKKILPQRSQSTIAPALPPADDPHRIPRPRPIILPAYLEALTLSPNPFVDQVNLSLTVPKATRFTLELFDAQGRQVYSTPWQTRAGNNAIMLPLPQLKLQGSQFYFRVTDDQGHSVSRPLIRR